MLHQTLTTAPSDYGWLSEESDDGPAAGWGRRDLFIIDPLMHRAALSKGPTHGSQFTLPSRGTGRSRAALVFLPHAGPALCGGCGAWGRRWNGPTDCPVSDIATLSRGDRAGNQTGDGNAALGPRGDPGL